MNDRTPFMQEIDAVYGRVESEPFAEQALDAMSDHMASIEWGPPGHVGHKWVYWDADAGHVWEEDMDDNCMKMVPLGRWLAGRQLSFSPPRKEEKRFDDLRDALNWLMQ
jgi:hypothetical protein